MGLEGPSTRKWSSALRRGQQVPGHPFSGHSAVLCPSGHSPEANPLSAQHSGTDEGYSVAGDGYSVAGDGHNDADDGHNDADDGYNVADYGYNVAGGS